MWNEPQAIAWLAANRGFFDPTLRIPKDQLFAKKAVVELALLVAYRHRLEPAPLTPDWLALLDTVEQVASRPAYVEAAARDPRALLLYALTFAALRICGRENPEFAHVVEQCLATGYATAAERLPYRRMDLLHFLLISGFDPSAGSKLDETYLSTLLAQSPNVVELNDSDVYAITHALFYLTDFGQRPATTSADVPAILEALLRLAIAERNADLAGELLCCALPYGLANTAAGWNLLATMQQPDGRLPGPPGVVQPAPTDPPGYFAWKQAYHTTIVGVLASLMAKAPLCPVTLIPTVDCPLRTPCVTDWVARHLADADPRALGAETLVSLGCPIPGLDPDMLPSDPRTYASAKQLSAHGHLSLAYYPPITFSEPPSAADLIALTAGEPDRILWASPALREETIIRLAGELRQAIRAYHLHEVSTALRALLAIVGPADRLVSDGAAWLATQQRRDGSYGYLIIENLEVRLVFTQSANLLFGQLSQAFASIPRTPSSVCV